MAKPLAQEVVGREAARDLEILRSGGVLRGFYLAGGTGVALHLRHRRSQDFDFFTPRAFREVMLLRKISNLGRFELSRQDVGSIVGRFRTTRVTFLAYPYRLLRKPQRILDGVLVADLLDIAGMKIDVISRRGSKKDFIDLYAIIESGYALETLLDAFQRKYAGIKYNMVHILKSLIYFHDADGEEMPVMLTPLRWEAVKDFLRREVTSSETFRKMFE